MPKFNFSTLSEEEGLKPEIPSKTEQPPEAILEQEKSETTSTTTSHKTEFEADKKDSKIEIKVPIRVRMVMVTMIKMFDNTSKGITNKGGNLKELKYEIIELANRMSEK